MKHGQPSCFSLSEKFSPAGSLSGWWRKSTCHLRFMCHTNSDGVATTSEGHTPCTNLPVPHCTLQ
eukprot:2647205-Amphidinium_carterae.1